MENELDLALAGLILLVAGVALMPVAGHLLRTLIPERRVFFARWGFSHVGLVLLTCFAAVATMSALGPAASTLELLYRNLLILAVAGIAVLWIANRCELTGWRALGFAAGRDFPALIAGAIGFVFVLPILLGVQYSWPYLLDLLGVQVEPQAILNDLTALDGATLAHAMVIAILVQPLLEELLFRGFLQPLLVQNLSDRVGVIVTSMLFALLHGGAALPGVFVLSLVIGGVMLRTRRLSAAWLVHALNNATAIAIALLASDPTLMGGS